jgi:parvulin-like peptidyl-prolyl isomerase
MIRPALTTALAVVLASLVGPAPAAPVSKDFCVAFESERFVQRGDVSLTQLDFDAFLDKRVPEQHRAQFLNDPERIGQVLDNLLLTYQLADQHLEALGDDPLQQALLYQAVNRELANGYRDRYLAEQELQDYETSAREIYLTDETQFQAPATYSFDHIVISSGPAKGDFDALTVAVEAYRLIDSGESFDAARSALVEQHPQKNYSVTAVDSVTLDELLPPVASALSNAEVGQLLPPVRSNAGWHLMRVTGYEEPTRRPWESVKERAIEIAKSRHLEREWELHLRDLTSMEPEFTEGAVQQLLERYGLESGFRAVVEGMGQEQQD